MKLRDHLWLGVLLIGVAFIWLRDLAWVPVASETVPVLAALPLFVWLGAPWRFQPGPFQLHGGSLFAAGGLLVLGLALDLTLLLAAAWTLALWSWLRARVVDGRVSLRRLVLLPMMAFPWMTLDLAPLGWWFRITAAWAAEPLFSALGFVVVRQGTNLLVQGLPVEVAPACSGVNSLQAVLIAGLVLAWLELRSSRWFWLSLLSLPVLAWAANVLRICTVVAVALGWGTDFARGWFHEAGGWLVLMLGFFCWWFAIRSGWHWSAARRARA